MVPNNLFSEFKLDPNSFRLNEWTGKIIREVQETEDAFIFSTIKPFIDSITTMEISKKELTEAIMLVRMQREGINKYGSKFSDDFNKACVQRELSERAYNKGFEAGVKAEKDKIMEYLEVENDNT